MNTSATGGYLVPDTASIPPSDTALIDILQEWIAGVSGIESSLLRPRWQPDPPNLPGPLFTWGAFGIEIIPSEVYPSVTHYGEGEGYSLLRRQEMIHLLITMYGPESQKRMGLLREGMILSQNRDNLLRQGMSVVKSTPCLTIPEMIKNKWIFRTDMKIILCRKITNKYPILNMQSIPPLTIFS